MKKFLLIVLCLLLAFPLFAAAAPSRTVKNVISSNPAIPFELIEIDTLLDLHLEGYELIEALQITLEKPYEKVIWYLITEIKKDDQIKVAIINEDLILQDGVITKNNGIIVDFTDIEPGDYLLYFYRKVLK